LTGRFGARDLRAKGGIQLEQPDSQGRRDKEKEGDGKDLWQMEGKENDQNEAQARR
jgi:hypothetical protein